MLKERQVYGVPGSLADEECPCGMVRVGGCPRHAWGKTKS